MRKKNQKIKCSVASCKFNNLDYKECQLSVIKVGCGCNCGDPNCKDDTICDSFEETKK